MKAINRLIRFLLLLIWFVVMVIMQTSLLILLRFYSIELGLIASLAFYFLAPALGFWIQRRFESCRTPLAGRLYVGFGFLSALLSAMLVHSIGNLCYNRFGNPLI